MTDTAKGRKLSNVSIEVGAQISVALDYFDLDIQKC